MRYPEEFLLPSWAWDVGGYATSIYRYPLLAHTPSTSKFGQAAAPVHDRGGKPNAWNP